MAIHICAPQVERAHIQKAHCPYCKETTDFLCEDVEWYGWYVTCLKCGDRWGDGELMPRPFKPKWRAERLEDAKKKIENYKEQGILKGDYK